MKIKPIRTENDYNEALQIISLLMNANLNSQEGDKLEVMVTLVEAYEEKHYPVLPPDPIEAIIHQLESRKLTRKDLEPYIGSRARVSEILNRKRPLTLNMIRKLQDGLGLPAEILVKSYPI